MDINATKKTIIDLLRADVIVYAETQGKLREEARKIRQCIDGGHYPSTEARLEAAMAVDRERIGNRSQIRHTLAAYAYLRGLPLKRAEKNAKKYPSSYVIEQIIRDRALKFVPEDKVDEAVRPLRRGVWDWVEGNEPKAAEAAE